MAGKNARYSFGENAGHLSKNLLGHSIWVVAGEVVDGVAGTFGKAIDSLGDAAERLKDKLSGKA